MQTQKLIERNEQELYNLKTKQKKMDQRNEEIQ